MRRLTRILILLFILWAVGNPSTVRSQAPDLANDPASQTSSRLVVFEAFFRAT
jgi:hypothetical protein